NGIFSDLYDPSATSLRGFGGYLRLAKDAGSWEWETAVNYRSPGFEVNDIAFMNRADYVWTLANVMRVWNKPNHWYRNWIAIVGGQSQWNFDGDHTAGQLHAFTGGQLANYWNLAFYTELYPETSDDRLTRGGPVENQPTGRLFHARMNTDQRKRFVFSTRHNYIDDALGGWYYGGSGSITLKPRSNVQLSLG